MVLACAVLFCARAASAQTEGDALVPYRWATPPEMLAPINQPPLAGRGSVEIRDGRARAGTIRTEDGQAVLTLPDDAFDVSAADTNVAIEITPSDGASIGDPPKGRVYEGNAYRIRATSRPSGDPAAVNASVTVTLRIPQHSAGIQPEPATFALMRRAGARWERSPGALDKNGRRIVGTLSALGTFVAVSEGTPNPDNGPSATLYVIILGGVAFVGLVGTGVARARKRKSAREALVRARGKKKH